jgi:hypothetical protein
MGPSRGPFPKNSAVMTPVSSEVTNHPHKSPHTLRTIQWGNAILLCRVGGASTIGVSTVGPTDGQGRRASAAPQSACRQTNRLGACLRADLRRHSRALTTGLSEPRLTHEP